MFACVMNDAKQIEMENMMCVRRPLTFITQCTSVNQLTDPQLIVS